MAQSNSRTRNRVSAPRTSPAPPANRDRVLDIDDLLKKHGSVDSAVTALRQGLNLLSDNIGKMRSRLDPILRPPDIEANAVEPAEKVPQPPHSTLRRTILELVHDVEIYNRRIHATTESVDLDRRPEAAVTKVVGS